MGDGEIYEIIYTAANDSITVVSKTSGMQYATEIGKDNRISIVLESAAPAAGATGGAPSFAQLQALLKATGPGPEAINGRLAMLAIVGVVATELITGRGLVEQLTRASTPAHAAGLGLAVMAASLAPLLLGKVAPKVREAQAVGLCMRRARQRSTPAFGGRAAADGAVSTACRPCTHPHPPCPCSLPCALPTPLRSLPSPLRTTRTPTASCPTSGRPRLRQW